MAAFDPLAYDIARMERQEKEAAEERAKGSERHEAYRVRQEQYAREDEKLRQAQQAYLDPRRRAVKLEELEQQFQKNPVWLLAKRLLDQGKDKEAENLLGRIMAKEKAASVAAALSVEAARVKSQGAVDVQRERNVGGAEQAQIRAQSALLSAILRNPTLVLDPQFQQDAQKAVSQAVQGRGPMAGPGGGGGPRLNILRRAEPLAEGGGGGGTTEDVAPSIPRTIAQEETPSYRPEQVPLSRTPVMQDVQGIWREGAPQPARPTPPAPAAPLTEGFVPMGSAAGPMGNWDDFIRAWTRKLSGSPPPGNPPAPSQPVPTGLAPQEGEDPNIMALVQALKSAGMDFGGGMYE